MAGLSGDLDFLLSALFDRSDLHPAHLADLRRSGLTTGTICAQKIRTVPPAMIPRLLGFDPAAVRSALLLPFPDPAGGFMDHVRMKIFPPFTDRAGHTVKYLQPRGSGVRLYFPLATLDAALEGDVPLWFLEGEKKALAVAQLGLAAVGFCGIEGWHSAGSRSLLPDFAPIPLQGRRIELLPDGDVQTNPNVERGALRFAEALEARGARVRIVLLPASHWAAA